MPFTVEKKEGVYRSQQSFGGLVSAVGAYLDSTHFRELCGPACQTVLKNALAAGKIYDKGHFDFELEAGDDQTDEDIFRKLANVPDLVTIKVGGEASHARYSLHNPSMAQSLLEMIAHYEHVPSAPKI